MKFGIVEASFLRGFGILQQWWGILQEYLMLLNEPSVGNEQLMVYRNRTNCKLGVPRYEKSGVLLFLIIMGPSVQIFNEEKCQMTHHKIPL